MDLQEEVFKPQTTTNVVVTLETNTCFNSTILGAQNTPTTIMKLPNPSGKPDAGSRNCVTFFAWMDYANVLTEWSNAINMYSNKYISKIICVQPHRYQYPLKHDYDLNLINNKSNILSEIEKWIMKSEVIITGMELKHTKDDSKFLSDIEFLLPKYIKINMDLLRMRNFSVFHAGNLYLANHISINKLKDNFYRRIYSPNLFKVCPQIKNEDVVLYPLTAKIDFSIESLNNRFNNQKKLLILHCPSSLEKKGTLEINHIIKLLFTDKTISERFEYIQTTPPVNLSKILELKSRAVIYIDQFTSKLDIGGYGVASIEALSHGNITLCSLYNLVHECLESMNIKSMGEFPIFDIGKDLNKFYKILHYLCQQSNEELKKLCLKSREFYTLHLSPQNLVEKLEKSVFDNCKVNPRYSCLEPRNGKKILFFEPQLRAKTYKWSCVLHRLGYQIEIAHNNGDFTSEDDSHVFKYHKVSIPLNLLRQFIIGKYDILIFKDINPYVEFCLDAKINSLLLIGDIISARNGKFISELERRVFDKISPSQVIFSGFFIKRKVAQLFSPILMNSSIITNVPTFEVLNPLPKLSARDKKIHLIYAGSIQNNKCHRNYNNIFEKILKYSKSIVIHVLSTSYKVGVENLVPKKDLVIHDTLPCREVTNFLTQFDVGLCFFELGYDDKHYINIAEPNKFYDYLSAGLPVVVNKTEALEFLVSKYDCGVAIEDIDSNFERTLMNIINKPFRFSMLEESLDAQIKKLNIF